MTHLASKFHFFFIINRTFSNIIHATAEKTPRVAEMHLVVHLHTIILLLLHGLQDVFSVRIPTLPELVLHNSSFQRYSSCSQALLDQQHSVDAAIILWVVRYLGIFT